VPASCPSSCATRWWSSASSVAAVMPTHTTASTTICPTSSRSRRDQTRRVLAGRLKDITRAAQRVDHGVATVVDLLAQVGNVELDDVGPAAEVVTPYSVEDLGLTQHPLGVAHHEPQQLELGRSQRDRLA